MTFSRRAWAAALLFAAFAGTASADETIEGLAWMTGTWVGESGGVEMMEQWTDAKGGLMLGVHRDVKGGRVVSFEFMRIQATPQGVVYLARTPPRGAPATSFPAVEVGDRQVVFANPKHDFPQRILYRLTSDGSLHARVEGVVQGKTRFEEWTWSRAR